MDLGLILLCVVCFGSRYITATHDIKLYAWETGNDKDGLGVAVRK